MKNIFDRLVVNEITLYTEEDIQPGTPVTIGADQNAVKAAKGENFVGICTAKRGNYVSVAFSGAVTVPYSGAMEAGYVFLVADGEGKVKEDFTSSVQLFVLSVDAEKNLATILL